MKMKIEVECTPVEARSFLGLPDVSGVNAHLMDEVRRRMDANIAMLEPETLIRSWMNLGGQATDQFSKLMSAAAAGALGGAASRKE